MDGWSEWTEFVRGDYRTIVVCRFDNNGMLMTHSIKCEKLISPTLTKLKEQLGEAIEREDFEGAAEIQRTINKIRDTDQKPTL